MSIQVRMRGRWPAVCAIAGARSRHPCVSRRQPGIACSAPATAGVVDDRETSGNPATPGPGYRRDAQEKDEGPNRGDSRPVGDDPHRRPRSAPICWQWPRKYGLPWTDRRLERNRRGALSGGTVTQLVPDERREGRDPGIARDRGGDSRGVGEKGPGGGDDEQMRSRTGETLPDPVLETGQERYRQDQGRHAYGEAADRDRRQDRDVGALSRRGEIPERDRELEGHRAESSRVPENATAPPEGPSRSGLSPARPRLNTTRFRCSSSPARRPPDPRGGAAPLCRRPARSRASTARRGPPA